LGVQEKHGRIAELLLHPVCRLLIPLFVLSGFQQGFLYADYSKVIPTMHWAGVIADYGNHNCAAHSSDKSVHNNAPGLTSGTDRFCCLSQSLRHTAAGKKTTGKTIPNQGRVKVLSAAVNRCT